MFILMGPACLFLLTVHLGDLYTKYLKAAECSITGVYRYYLKSFPWRDSLLPYGKMVLLDKLERVKAMQMRRSLDRGRARVLSIRVFSFHKDFDSFFKNFMQRVLLACEVTDTALRLW